MLGGVFLFLYNNLKFYDQINYSDRHSIIHSFLRLKTVEKHIPYRFGRYPNCLGKALYSKIMTCVRGNVYGRLEKQSGNCKDEYRSYS